MSNVLAIAHKELKSYFSSPIAYIAIGMWALLYGWFFVAILGYFVRQSMQMNQFGMQGGPQAMNINQQMIRPLLQNVTILILFLMPMVTMRTYSEEKRSGTIELLLTSPITDVQIILGKFLGAMGLYAAMLAVTLIHLGILFLYGNPEWKPILTGYVGLFLMGACFLSVGMLISSLTKNQVVAGMVTFAVFLMLWVINWIGSFVGPTAQAVLSHLSITEHYDDFARGVLDTKHLVYYLSFIGLGLFLTAKSVDSERWRG
jgi:ABC-2 type transport system permease protein